MDETPVTVAQYREAVNVGACTPPEGTDKIKFSNWDVVGRENHPVNCIDWHQACAYAKWAGKRLPTEEEWEWAARGGDDGRMYPWGTEAPSDQLCWSGEGNDLGKDNRESTSPVGSYPRGNSRHGLQDMAGNVWEWTSSTYPSTLVLKICRGGSWFNHYYGVVRTSYRNFYPPEIRYDDFGFRCVKSA